MGCVDSEQNIKNQEAFLKLAKKFEKIPIIKNQYSEHSVGMFMRILETTRDATVGYKGFDNGIPNVEQLKIMERIIDREVKNLTRTRGGFAKWLYLPNEIFNDVSFVHKWYQDVQKSNELYKGHTSYFNSQMNDIIRDLKLASAAEGVKFSKAEKKLVSLYQKYNKLKLKGQAKGESKYFKEAEELYLEKIMPFVEKGEGRILHQFHLLVSKPEKEFLRDQGRYSSTLYDAAKTYRYKVQKPAQKLMIQGLVNYKWALERNRKSMKRFENYDKTLKNIDNIIERFQKGDLQRDGYFPVLSFDIMPSLSKASEFLFHPKGKGEQQQADFQKGVDIIKKLEGVLNDNIYVNGHLNEQSKLNDKIDYNVIPIIHSFVKSAARFNYVAFNAGKYIDVMKNISETATDPNTKKAQTQLDKKLQFLEGYISDHYGLITGEYLNKNRTAAHIARSITAFQFASKLGLNIRGATRNATQSLFNYVWFGHQALWDVTKMKRNADMKIRMDAGLANNGILFPEIQEIYGQLPFQTILDKNTGTYKMKVDLSTGEKLQEALVKVSSASGFLMTGVENKINRRFTFEFAYGKQWQLDKADPFFIGKFEKNLKDELKREKVDGKARKVTVEELRKEEKQSFQIFEKNDATEYQYRLEMYRRNSAENGANTIVNNIHFDYSVTGKSKILTTPLGGVAGQFQHYGLSFFNLQRKIVRDGADSVFTGQWNTNSAWRMYRLGLMYTAVNALFAPLFNANLGNLIQNDTMERIENYHAAAVGTEEEKKRAFYGKGPLIGTFGGPFISDMVTIGNVFNLYEMEEDSWPAYLAGYQDMADVTGSEKGKEVVRLLNTQSHRFFFNTFPKWKKGTNLGVLIQGGLGLYPTQEQRETRKGWGLDQTEEPKPKPIVQHDFNKAILQSLDTLSKP